MRIPPLRDALVGSVQVCVRANEISEQGEQETAADDDEESERQGEAGCGSRVEPRLERTAQGPVAADHLPDLSRAREGGLRRGGRPRKAPDQEADRKADSQSEDEQQQQRHVIQKVEEGNLPSSPLSKRILPHASDPRPAECGSGRMSSFSRRVREGSRSGSARSSAAATRSSSSSSSCSGASL